MTTQAVLSQTDQRRLERLAKAAGRTPRAMLKYVLRDGFPETERVVLAVNKSRASLGAGRTVAHDEVMRQGRELIACHGSKEAA